MIFAILALLFSSQTGHAQFSNYNSILIGDQAAGMGGAYTALYKDASALSWYNPGALAFLEGRSFSASVGIYKKFDTRFGEKEDFAKASLEVNQGFFRALPSSTGSVHRFRSYLVDWTFAFSILVPSFESFKGNIRNKDGNVSNLQTIDESLWVGFSAAKMISATQALGMSVYYTARSYTRTVSDRFVDTGVTTIYNEEKAFTQNAIVPIIGYQEKLSESVRLGLSVRFRGVPVAGKASYDEALYSSLGSVTTVNRPNLKTRALIPGKVSIGGSWQANDRLLMSADVSLYEGASSEDVSDPDVKEHLIYKSIVNGALGSEIEIKEWLHLRLGAFTNFAAHPNPEAGKVRGQGDRVDQLGFSSNVALRSDAIEYTFGGYYTGGRGRSVQRVNQQYEVLTKSQQVFTMLVGASYNF